MYTCCDLKNLFQFVIFKGSESHAKRSFTVAPWDNTNIGPVRSNKHVTTLDCIRFEKYLSLELGYINYAMKLFLIPSNYADIPHKIFHISWILLKSQVVFFKKK